MFGLTLVEKLLFGLDLATTLFLLIKLASNGLFRIYPLFYAFLGVSLAEGVAISFLKAGTDPYGWMFIAAEAVRTLFAVVIVLDQYSLILKDLTGIRSFAKRYFTVVLGVSIVVSLVLLSIEQSPSSTLLKYYVFHRAISTSIVLFILLITIFLWFYPVKLKRNVIVYTIGFAIYFLAHAIGFLLITTGSADQAWRLVVSKMLQGVSLAALVAWIVLLNQHGEINIRAAVRRLSPEQEHQVLSKLEAVNASLMRASKDLK